MTASGSFRLRLMTGAFVLLGCVRIVSTYAVFSPTFDEAGHIEAGLEWWEDGRYTLEPHHTPLARIMVAAGPFLIGERLLDVNRARDKPDRITYTRDPSIRTLALARGGILPFFVLSALVVWLWARYVSDERTALAAVAIFTMLPPILAHSGLATTDMALSAMFTGLLYAFVRWLDSPTIPRGVVFGIAAALSIAAKVSAILFFAVAIVPIRALWRASTKYQQAGELSGARSYGKSLGVALLAAALVLWSAYRFSVGSFHGVPLPMPELFSGIRDVALHNASGHKAYLLGHTSTDGWWYFFPVALAVKTPLPFLVLVAVGLVAAIRAGRNSGDWRPMVPAVAAAAILIIVMPIRINLGVRHVLPLYSLLSITAAQGIVFLWRGRSRAMRAVPVALAAWLAIGSLRSHPDYLPYFNELAGNHPERVLIDSDLDWGQDLLRLRDTLKARDIESLSIAYYGTAGVRHYLGAGANEFPVDGADDRPTGWFAISESHLQFDRFRPTDGFDATRPGKFAWLRARVPVAKVGKSIRLYFIDPATGKVETRFP